MKTVKLSYSILHAWETGRWEDAVGYYLGKEIPSTVFMDLGKTMHEKWADYTIVHGQMHPEVRVELLVNPIVEQKYEKRIPFSDDIEILVRGVIDLENNNTLIDYKCGRTVPSSYVAGWQLDLYKLLRPKANLGKYICFNPYTNEVSTGIKFLDDLNAEDALNNIITWGSELIDYLQTNKLLIDYKETI
jgi:hypothetical protein